jgi:hypothetical protein
MIMWVKTIWLEKKLFCAELLRLGVFLPLFYGDLQGWQNYFGEYHCQNIKRPFHTLSAISAGVKDIRETIDSAKKQKFFDTPSPILFIDEIHRFSKSQQDSYWVLLSKEW